MVNSSLRWHSRIRFFVLIGILLILFSSLVAVWRVERSLRSSSHIFINSHSIAVETLNTTTARTKGLSGRSGLPADTGVLFVYDQAGQHGIWMKDMRFIIDVAWIDERGTIIYLVDDMKPESYPQVFAPPSPASYVLELPQAATASYGLQVGTVVDNLPRLK